MSVTLEPTSSMITGSLSSIISPTASSIISSTISSVIESATSSSSSSSSISPEATAATTSSSAAEQTPSCQPKKGSIDLCWDGYGYLDNALNTANIGSQFTICIAAGILLFMIFCIFRTRIPVLFSPRSNMKRHKPPELPTSLFGWIWPLLKISDEEMLANVGLDALLMLKFVTMGIKIFGVCTIFGIIVFIPITMTSDYTHLGNDTSPLDRISISVIEQDSNKIIAYLVFAYVFTFVTFFFLTRNYNDYIYLRAKYLLKQSKSMVSRTVIVTGIPDRLRSDQALAEYYENLGVGPVESCYVVRTVHRLNTMIKKRAQALINLEEAYAKYWGNPCRIPGYDPDRILDDVDMYKKVLDLAEKRPDSSSDEEEEDDELNSEKSEEGSSTLKVKKLKKKKKLGNTTFFKGLVEPMNIKKTVKSKRPLVRVGGFLGIGGKKVDAIEYYTKLFDDLDKIVMDRRSSPNFEMTNVAFVTFESMSSAIIASQIAINPEPFACRTSMACEPRDVLWSAISIRGRERIIREAIIWSITVVVCLTWSAPVTAISALLSISTIKKINPALGERMESIPAVRIFFGSFIPPLILNIFTSVLPLIFDTMGYYQGLRSRSAVAESTLSKQYFFLIFFTLIFYSVVGTTVSTVLEMFTSDPQGITKLLANALPKLAPFFINYTILQGFLIMPLNLLLLGAIIVRGFNHLFICSTPREYAENRAPWAFNYGIGYPAPLLVFAIVFEYSLICPLVLLFGTVYFCFTYVVYKYQFLYVYFRPYEAAGKLWTMVIPRVIFTLILFQLTMVGLFLLRGSYILGGLVVPLILITILFRYILSLAYSQNAHNLPMQLLKDNLQKLPTSDDEDSEDDDSSCDERIDEAENQARLIEEKKAEEEKRNEVRSRWKKAALSAVNLKPQLDASAAATKTDSKSTIIRPRHRKVVLDEDDYEATPDKLTDYRQPPMQLNPGLLDAGLKKYGNPLLVGYLPQLWLPVKMPGKGEEAKKPPVGRRKSDLLQNRHDGSGGNLAQHLAEILRKVERDNKAKEDAVAAATATSSKNRLEQEEALIAEARKTAHDDAASIVTGKTAHPKINILRSMFKRGQIKKTNVKIEHTPAEDFRLQHLKNQENKAEDATLDQAERGAAVPEPQRQDSGGSGGSARDADSVKSTARSVHQVYYHHPERRHSHAFNINFLAPHHRVEMRHSGLSSPAIFPPVQTDDIEDAEEAAHNISRPDTQNSRLSSDPLIKKDTV